MTWGLGGEGQAWGGWRLALVFLFLFGWTAYSTEICATFSPEYKRSGARHGDRTQSGRAS